MTARAPRPPPRAPRAFVSADPAGVPFGPLAHRTTAPGPACFAYTPLAHSRPPPIDRQGVLAGLLPGRGPRPWPARAAREARTFFYPANVSCGGLLPLLTELTARAEERG
jgi:hypothetical protein